MQRRTEQLAKGVTAQDPSVEHASPSAVPVHVCSCAIVTCAEAAQAGCGNVFNLSRNRRPTMLHTFAGGADGATSIKRQVL
jgi:hypothetical protein